MWALVTKNGAAKPLSHRFATLWEPHLGPMRIYWTVSERLSEKSTSNGPSEDLAAIRSAKWTEKPFLGGPLGYAGSASETFRTVSEGVFPETWASGVWDSRKLSFRHWKLSE